MEKVLSVEDRIKRAEQIYYRRNNERVGKTAKVNVNSNIKHNLLKKVVFQILVCIFIYLGIYGIQANTDNFSIDSINYIENVLKSDIDLLKIIDEGKRYLGIVSKVTDDNLDIEDENNLQEETLGVNEDTAEVIEEKTEKESEKNIEEENPIEESSSINQMEQDAKYIKENYSLIKPLEGTITSRFGIRNPTTQTVPIYHTGIDIAADEGTIYLAAMEGTVELVSSEGDYR